MYLIILNQMDNMSNFYMKNIVNIYLKKRKWEVHTIKLFKLKDLILMQIQIQIKILVQVLKVIKKVYKT